MKKKGMFIKNISKVCLILLLLSLLTIGSSMSSGDIKEQSIKLSDAKLAEEFNVNAKGQEQGMSQQKKDMGLTDVAYHTTSKKKCRSD